MSRRTHFTNVTPLPAVVSREVAIAMLHNHDEMIELNPLVIKHHPIKTPRDAPADEFLDCVWQELTDNIHYLPGGLIKGNVTYKACFHDIPNGLETHIYAPMGLEIREKWSIGGSLPGEPPEARELGLNLPITGLYLREDGNMKCNIMMSSFVRKNLDNAHKVLVERMLKKAERVEEHRRIQSSPRTEPSSPIVASGWFQRGSHMSQSSFINSSTYDTFQSFQTTAMPSPIVDMSIHPAFRNDPEFQNVNRLSTATMPTYEALFPYGNGYPSDTKSDPDRPQQRPRPQSYSSTQSSRSSQRRFIAELPGSTPDRASYCFPTPQPRQTSISELSASGSSDSQSSTHYSSDTSLEAEDTISAILVSCGNIKYKPESFSGHRKDSKHHRVSRLPALRT